MALKCALYIYVQSYGQAPLTRETISMLSQIHVTYMKGLVNALPEIRVGFLYYSFDDIGVVFPVWFISCQVS